MWPAMCYAVRDAGYRKSRMQIKQPLCLLVVMHVLRQGAEQPVMQPDITAYLLAQCVTAYLLRSRLLCTLKLLLQQLLLLLRLPADNMSQLAFLLHIVAVHPCYVSCGLW